MKKTISPCPSSEAAEKVNIASSLWPRCWFTPRDLLASFSVCQHLLVTPEQGHRVADAPRRRRLLVTQQQLCSGSWGGSRLLHPFAWGRDPERLSASSIHGQAATFRNLPCPQFVPAHPKVTLWCRTLRWDKPSSLGPCRRSPKSRWLCKIDPVMDAGSSILSFIGGIFPFQELENRGPGYHLPRGLVNHPIFQLTTLVCFGRSPS